MMIELLMLLIFACFLTFISFSKEKLILILAGPMWIFIGLQLVQFSKGFFFITMAFGLILVYYGVERAIT